MKTKRFASTITLAILKWVLTTAVFMLAVLLVGSARVTGQSLSDLPSYWQYSTSGRLREIVAADINRDGVDDFLISDENNHLDLITASGIVIWKYIAPDTVTSIGVIELAGGDNAKPGIVVGMQNQLILLEANGNEIWRTVINPPEMPPNISGAEEPFTIGTPNSDPAVYPIAISAYHRNFGERPEILVLLQTGELILFDADGIQTWRHADNLTAAAEGLPPRILVADFDGDGQDEIVHAILNPRRYGQLFLIDDLRVVWDLSLSRSVTDLEKFTYSDVGQPLIAVSTTSGEVHLLDYLRRQHWWRTLNIPVTVLSTIRLPGQTILVAGTETGLIVAFDEKGRRIWSAALAEEGGQPVIDITSVPSVIDEREPILAATVETLGDISAAAAYLVDGQGRTVALINNVDARGLTKFVDSNHDHNNELLVSRFATLESLGVGVGNTGNVEEWEYSLNAAPSAVLLADLDGDAADELIIGTRDGRVHNLGNNRTLNWLHDTGGMIQSLALFDNVGPGSNSVVVAGNSERIEDRRSGWIQFRDFKGERVWQYDTHYPLTSITISDIVPGGNPEIIVGEDNGFVTVLSSSGDLIWESSVFNSQPITHIANKQDASSAGAVVIIGGDTEVAELRFEGTEFMVRPIASFAQQIESIIPFDSQGNPNSGLDFIVATSDSQLHGIDRGGNELAGENWPFALGAKLSAAPAIPGKGAFPSLPQGGPILLSTDSERLLRVDIAEDGPRVSWEMQDQGKITDANWFDRNADGAPDILVVGNQDGLVTLYEEAESGPPLLLGTPLSLNSAVFSVATIARDAGPTPNLLVVGENGLVQLFRDQENRPPLLTEPSVATDQGQYSISVNVTDVEGDVVSIVLELKDPETGNWIAQGTEKLVDGSGSLFWALPSPPASPEGLAYRFLFSDGSFAGMMTPAVGPVVETPSALAAIAPILIVGAAVSGLILGLAYIRQAQTPGARASRLYRRISENKSQTLQLLEEEIGSGASLELIPHIASEARRLDNKVITNLAGGLLLLPDQPLSGIPILSETLQSIPKTADDEVAGQDRWQILMRTSQMLLEAPSITELTLLHPQLQQLVAETENGDGPGSAFTLLPPILDKLRDSERVDLTDDRLVYLSEASMSLERVQDKLPNYAPSMEHLLTSAIIRRWSGLVAAEIADLRGRAELTVSLKTGRLVPTQTTPVVFEIFNSGRALAENLVAELDENPAYEIVQGCQDIAFLPPGRKRELFFSITPKVEDRFRISMTMTYDDHNEHNRQAAFADMVHILPPVREFSSISNPYTPGTPLRKGSLLFFGRQDLFDFIAENAGQRSYRNVLILVGQRRTGKTSALLRLEDHLPSDLLPVYIDCQSLGVIPGMPALLEELAWYISDALAKKGIKVGVPDLTAWQQDPTRLFQRQFLPTVRSLLPPGATLLLIFDEFEAFESLVAEGILPSTFFTYLRHLMQHSEQLNFIFVGTRRLEAMTTDYWSVLFNIALYRKIDFLGAESAMRLITEPVAPNLIYDDLALDKILRATAGHPYFLQLVCYTLVKQANIEKRSYVTISNVNEAIDEMLSLGEVHFAYLWNRSSLAERAILAAAAHLLDHNLPFHPEELIRQLDPYDIHLDPADVTSALNSLSERDILREVTEGAKSMYEVKLALVTLWVARNKSLSKLYVGNGAANNARPLKETLQDN